MAKATTPDTFRCHITMRGEQCPCEMTRVNSYTFTLPTLDRKAKQVGKTAAEILAAHAICPWHARLLQKMGKNIPTVDGVIKLIAHRNRMVRMGVAMEEAYVARRTRKERAYMPAMAVALIAAGVRQHAST